MCISKTTSDTTLWNLGYGKDCKLLSKWTFYCSHPPEYLHFKDPSTQQVKLDEITLIVGWKLDKKLTTLFQHGNNDSPDIVLPLKQHQSFNHVSAMKSWRCFNVETTLEFQPNFNVNILMLFQHWNTLTITSRLQSWNPDVDQMMAQRQHCKVEIWWKFQQNFNVEILTLFQHCNKVRIPILKFGCNLYVVSLSAFQPILNLAIRILL